MLERKLEWAAAEAEAADEEMRAMCRLLGESRHQDALGRIRAVLEGKDMQFAFGDLCSAREHLRLAGLLDDDGAPVFRVSTLWPREFGRLPEMAEVTITAPKSKD